MSYVVELKNVPILTIIGASFKFQRDRSMYRLMYAFFCVAILGAHSVIAEEFRVASVDMNRIINESKDSKSKREALQIKSEKKRKELEAKKIALKDLEKKFTSGAVKDDSKEADEFRSKGRDLARAIKDSEEELKSEYMRATRELVKSAVLVIEKFSKEKNISLVLERSQGQPSPILYGSESMDITDAVLAKMNG